MSPGAWVGLLAVCVVGLSSCTAEAPPARGLAGPSPSGVIEWGTRVSDGDSDNWMYSADVVQQLTTQVEQDLRLAMQAYAFSANDEQSWSGAEQQISAALLGLWQANGLTGATPEDAFSAECGATQQEQDADEMHCTIRVNIDGQWMTFSQMQTMPN